MSDRSVKRKTTKQIKKIVEKAKQDMSDWVSKQGGLVTDRDMEVWQQGYIYGLNRGAGKNDSND